MPPRSRKRAARDEAEASFYGGRKKPRDALEAWLSEGERLGTELWAASGVAGSDLRQFSEALARVRDVTVRWRSRSRMVLGDEGMSTHCLEFCGPRELAVLRAASRQLRAAAGRESLWRRHCERVLPVCGAMRRAGLSVHASDYDEYRRVATHGARVSRTKDQKFLAHPPRADAEFALAFDVRLPSGARAVGVSDVTSDPSTCTVWGPEELPELNALHDRDVSNVVVNLSLVRRTDKKILCIAKNVTFRADKGDVSLPAFPHEDDHDRRILHFSTDRKSRSKSGVLRATSFLIKRTSTYEYSSDDEDEFDLPDPKFAEPDIMMMFDEAPSCDGGANGRGDLIGLGLRLVDDHNHLVPKPLVLLDGLGDGWV